MDRDVFISCNHSDLDKSLAASLKTAAVRALSVELASDKKEKIETGIKEFMVFKAQDEWHVLSATFLVKDSEHPRGFVRTFNVMLLTNKRNLLLRETFTILELLRSLIQDIQSSALAKFDTTATMQKPKLDLDRRRMVYPPLRHLSKLTNDDIFITVHKAFVKIFIHIFYSAVPLSGQPKSNKTIAVNEAIDFEPLIAKTRSQDFKLILASLMLGCGVVIQSEIEWNLIIVQDFVCQCLPFVTWCEAIHFEDGFWVCATRTKDKAPIRTITLSHSNNIELTTTPKLAEDITDVIFHAKVPPNVKQIWLESLLDDWQRLCTLYKACSSTKAAVEKFIRKFKLTSADHKAIRSFTGS